MCAMHRISRRRFGLGTLGALLGSSLLAAEEEERKKFGKVSKGSLFLIGGSANTSLKSFVKFAGGEKANIVVLPHASSMPAEVGDAEENEFSSLGVKQTSTILPDSKAGLPQGATAVYISGGDQNRLMRLLADPLRKQLIQFFEDGGLVGGTSAGAAAAAPRMIAGGMADGVLKPNALRLTKGLGLLDGVVIDTHVKERERNDRLMAAISAMEDVVGIGLDEDTAIYVQQEVVKVFGRGHVRVYKRGIGFKSDLLTQKDEANGTVENVLLSCYGSGSQFSL